MPLLPPRIDAPDPRFTDAVGLASVKSHSRQGHSFVGSRRRVRAERVGTELTYETCGWFLQRESLALSPQQVRPGVWSTPIQCAVWGHAAEAGSWGTPRCTGLTRNTLHDLASVYAPLTYSPEEATFEGAVFSRKPRGLRAASVRVCLPGEVRRPVCFQHGGEGFQP